MQDTELMKPYKYTIEVGHSKSGSDHVLVIKSLKVNSDTLNDAVAEMKAAIAIFNEMGVGQ